MFFEDSTGNNLGYFGTANIRGNLETGFIFQEREGCHISADDYSESLLMVVQEQEDNVHGQVSCTRVRK